MLQIGTFSTHTHYQYVNINLNVSKPLKQFSNYFFSKSTRFHNENSPEVICFGVIMNQGSMS